MYHGHAALVSNKLRNKLVKARNGNIAGITKLKVIHWNAGSRLWQNKLLDIKTLLIEEEKKQISVLSQKQTSGTMFLNSIGTSWVTTWCSLTP